MSDLNKSSCVILGLLSKGKSSGYRLKQVMAKVTSSYWGESNAQIYPILKKLEQAGLVHSAVDKGSGKRNRKDFTISEEGRKVLMSWLLEPVEVSPYREELLLKMSLSQHLSVDQVRAHLMAYQQQIVDRLRDIDDILSHISLEHAGKPDQRPLIITYDHVKMILDAKYKWCKKTLKELDS